jgi:prepilin peptidase CpaA
MLHADLSLAFMAAFTFLVVHAVISDVTRLVIPDWVSIALVALFALFLVLGDKPLPPVRHALVAAAVLLPAFAAFAAGYMGGGDVKLMTALALWAGPDKVLPFLLVMSIAGAALAAVVVSGTYYLRWNEAAEPASGLSRLFPRWVRRGLTPYGFAIGIGGLAIIPARFF